MNRKTILLSGATLGALAAVLWLRTTPAQPARTPAPASGPDDPSDRFVTRFVVRDAPEHFEIELKLVDFPPHTRTRPHTPGGTVYTTVVDGDIATSEAGVARTYEPGDAFVTETGQWVQIGNAGDIDAHAIETILLPPGAPSAIDENGFSISPYASLGTGHRGLDTTLDIRPMIVERSSMLAERPTDPFELAQWLVEFAPGQWTSLGSGGGQEFGLVTAGEFTVDRDGAVDIFGPGAAWLTPAGVSHAEVNDGEVDARAVTVRLSPQPTLIGRRPLS
jgi:quercetin dioxygenase-like cupin family protein